MRMNNVEMNDNALKMVNGGNYGDTKMDCNKNPLYYDYVEVYDNFLHTTTTRYKIKERYFILVDGHWTYVVYDENNPAKEITVTADDIERPANYVVTQVIREI